MTVRAALHLINQSLTEVLSEQEDEFDPDTRWAISWFEQHGFGHRVQKTPGWPRKRVRPARAQHFFHELHVAGRRQRRGQASRHASELPGLREMHKQDAFHAPSFSCRRSKE